MAKLANNSRTKMQEIMRGLASFLGLVSNKYIYVHICRLPSKIPVHTVSGKRGEQARFQLFGVVRSNTNLYMEYIKSMTDAFSF